MFWLCCSLAANGVITTELISDFRCDISFLCISKDYLTYVATSQLLQHNLDCLTLARIGICMGNTGKVN
jgi:hypothetical protein